MKINASFFINLRSCSQILDMSPSLQVTASIEFNPTFKKSFIPIHRSVMIVNPPRTPNGPNPNQATVVVFSTRTSCCLWEGPLVVPAFLDSAPSSYAASWTPRAARPDGSRFFDHAASHSTAFAVLQATLGPPGTVDLAAFCSEAEIISISLG